MQTVKTTIVVVLLLTVSYSAYVALTAPPAKVPSEIEKMLVENEDFSTEGDIDTGFAIGDEAFDMGGGLPPILAGDPVSEEESGDSFSISDENFGVTPLEAENLAGDATGAVPPGMEFTSPSADEEPKLPVKIPAVDASAGPVAPIPGMDYPDTGQDSPDFDSLANQYVGEPIPGNTKENPHATETGIDSLGSDSASLSADDDLARQAAKTSLANAIATADRQREKQQLREALTTLSMFYNEPALEETDRDALLSRLDWLAGQVIYSTQHLLERPYRISQGETVKDVADQLQVPWELLAIVNGVNDPAEVTPGQELKVIRGPFRAEVNLTRSELTLFLGELYAGRFPIQLGQDPAPAPGVYDVKEKRTDRTYYAPSGLSIPAGDSRNPYGDVWIDLGQRVCIHGSPDGGESTQEGCIQLRSADARDVFGILSRGSGVLIVR